MTSNTTRTSLKLSSLFALAALSLTPGCSLSSVGVKPSPLGEASSTERVIEAVRQPAGVVRFERVEAADWAVDRAGLINLDHPRAEGLEEGLEPIVIPFYVIEHPAHGRFLIDSGVAASFRDPETAPVSGLVASEMNMDRLVVRQDTRTWLADAGPVKGVFLTHLHLDHIMGLPDVPLDVPVYTGPGETSATSFINLFVRGVTDDLVHRDRVLYEWDFAPDPQRRFEGVVDVFGDGSVFALHTPGHTPGHTSYLVRTAEGAHLVVGDASHTEWGWTRCVEPGQFSSDIPESVVSLRRLRGLADASPAVTVHLGHQHHDAGGDHQDCPAP